MRFLTFSVVRNCRQWLGCGSRSRGGLASDAVQVQTGHTAATQPVDGDGGAHDPRGDPSLICFAPSWPPDVEPGLRARMAGDMRVLGDFVTEAEEASLMQELEPALKRMRYEYDHWDDAIHGYKETERGDWQPHNATVMARVTRVAFTTTTTRQSGTDIAASPVRDEDRVIQATPGEPLTRCHVLDLAPAGHIKPHIDAVRYCGAVIAGLCLMSDAVMRLQHPDNPDLALDALLPRRGLYIMSGVARYAFTHAVLGGEHSVWRGQRVVKRRRVAIITRSAPVKVDDSTDPVFYTTRQLST